MSACSTQEDSLELTDSTDFNLWKPDILVLGSGGGKGYLQLGALLNLETNNIIDNVIAYVGCSVGAVIGLLLVAGYDVQEIIEEVTAIELFLDIYHVSLKDSRLNEGLISNQSIHDLLCRMLREKFGFVPTLHQLYQATGKVFTTVTVNITHPRVEYMSHETEPGISSVEAVMLSMNIPFLFYRLRYKSCTYIDGAYGDPYPINIYDDGNYNILGISTPSVLDVGLPNNSTSLQYALQVLNWPINQLRRMNIRTASNHCKHLELYSDIEDAIGITFTDDQKAKMMLEGYDKSVEFINSLKNQRLDKETQDTSIFDHLESHKEENLVSESA